MEQPDHPFALFSGSSCEEFAKRVAKDLGVDLGRSLRETFPDGEIGVQIQENIRGKDVFVFQTLAKNPNGYLMELLIMVDACKRASARTITAVIPYFAYARQDRKDKPRVAITARLVADLLERAGVTRVLTMDLHTEQIQGFFDIPLDHLCARSLFVKTFQKLSMKNAIVVSPDLGSNRMARKFAQELDVDLAIVDKRRMSAQNVRLNAIIGDVKGKEVVLFDDICSTGATLSLAANACRDLGAKSIFAVVTHGLFTTASEKNLKDCGIDRFYTTDTVFQNNEIIKPIVISVAPLFAKAINCVVRAESMSSLF